MGIAMASAAHAEKLEDQDLAPVSERTQIFQNCKSAFDRIRKHGTPPDPVTYALWYAYVTRTPAGVRLAIDKLLASGGALDSYELNEIYNEFLGRSEVDDTNETIGREIEDSIQNVSKLLETGITQNAHFRTTLSDLQTTPTSEAPEQDFRSLLTTLISESQKMSVVSTRLTDGLRESQARVKKLNEELEQARKQSLLDPLTSVANRRAFENRLKWQIQDAEQTRNGCCLVLADLDDFKSVNDNLGHQAGDAVLKAFAATLFDHTKGSDLVARYGGDEFGILLENISNIEMVTTIAERILNSLSQHFNVSRNQVFVNVSIGINWGSVNYEKPEYLLRDADTAMYGAKALGRGRFHIFDPEMHREAIQILELENDLRRAINKQELIVYYQPIISLNSGSIIGLEALVRWQHPTKGLILPTEFISMAEETGLIHAIDTWVLKSACNQLRIWQNHPAAPKALYLSVNLSAKLFIQPNFLAQIDKIIYETKVNPASLELEITESVFMENNVDVKTTLQEIKERNIKLTMDDFGTGYSSLSYLHNFPLNTLKIDKSFLSIFRSLNYLVPLLFFIFF